MVLRCWYYISPTVLLQVSDAMQGFWNPVHELSDRVAQAQLVVQAEFKFKLSECPHGNDFEQCQEKGNCHMCRLLQRTGALWWVRGSRAARWPAHHWCLQRPLRGSEYAQLHQKDKHAIPGIAQGLVSDSYLKIHGQSGILIETTVIMRILLLGLDFKSTQGCLHSCDWVYAGRVQESHAASSTKTHQADARSASRASCKICSSTNWSCSEFAGKSVATRLLRQLCNQRPKCSNSHKWHCG